MSVLQIRTDPDDALRTLCEPVQAFDTTLKAFVDDLFETMYAAPGRGLAAPQVGVLQRVFVMDPTWKTGTYAPRAFVNPKIVSVSSDVVAMEEGCLSIPGVLSTVTRPASVTLRWFDVAGDVHEDTFDSFSAACIQHENDHLNGVLCTDYPQ